MNPEIDLKSFRSGAASSAGDFRTEALIDPPKRILTRYVLPMMLFSAIAAVSGYAARDALIPATGVRVVQPVLASGGGDSASVSYLGSGDGDEENEGPAAPTSAAESGEPLFQAPGWVEPDPFTTVVSALTAGTVARMHVREGESVGAGQIVAELDSGDAMTALRQAEAARSVRQAELEAAQAGWENPIALEATIKTAQAEKARLEAEREKVLRQSVFYKRQAEISRKLGLQGADSSLAAEKSAMEAGVADATLKEIDARILSQAATLEAASKSASLRLEDKSRLALANAQMEEAAADVDEANLRVARCRIAAPSTGTIMRIFATPGSMISMDVPHGTQLVSMYDPGSLQVRAEVPLAEAGKVRVGLPVEIRVEAMPERVFQGKLTRIVHEADVQRNSLPVKVRILDPEPTLKPEMVARLQFKSLGGSVAPPPETGGDSQRGGGELFIPGSLVSPDAKGETRLWLVGPDLRAHEKTVTLGRGRRGDLREVTAGLLPSDKLIVSGFEKLKEGSRVRIAAME